MAHRAEKCARNGPKKCRSDFTLFPATDVDEPTRKATLVWSPRNASTTLSVMALSSTPSMRAMSSTMLTLKYLWLSLTHEYGTLVTVTASAV